MVPCRVETYNRTAGCCLWIRRRYLDLEIRMKIYERQKRRYGSWQFVPKSIRPNHLCCCGLPRTHVYVGGGLAVCVFPRSMGGMDDAIGDAITYYRQRCHYYRQHEVRTTKCESVNKEPRYQTDYLNSKGIFIERFKRYLNTRVNPGKGIIVI